MTNSLIKDVLLQTVAGTEEVPAIPYRAGQPSRTATEQRTVCSMHYNVPGYTTYVTDSNGQQVGVFRPTDPSYSGLVGTYSCSLQTVTVTYPPTAAQPYVPGYSVATTYTVPSYNLGWNAGARSIAQFTNDGEVQFQVRETAVGAIVGVNVYDGVGGYTGTTIDYAVICQRGLARVMRNGAVGLALGAYTDATVFKINRTAGAVKWYVDGVEKLSISGEPSTTAAWLEAALYSGDDEVFNPVVTQIGSPDTTAQTGDMSAASLSSMIILASESSTYGDMSGGALSAMTFDGYTGRSAPAYGVADMSVPPMSMFGTGLTGEIGQMDGSMSAMTILAADHAYGEMNASLSEMWSIMDGREGNFRATMAAYGVVSDKVTARTFLVVTMNSRGAFTTTMAPRVAVPAEMWSHAQMGDTWATQQVLQAVMNSVMRAGSVLGVPTGSNADAETWVVNLDGTEFGSTTYSNFNFNSYAFMNGVYCAANSSGLYALEGDTDAGTPIHASIDFGLRDAGNPNRKTWQQAYVGVSASGNLFIKLVTEGQEYVYKMRSFDASMQTQRVTFGKGLRANYVQPILYNENGADFELDTVTFVLADLSRKI